MAITITPASPIVQTSTVTFVSFTLLDFGYHVATNSITLRVSKTDSHNVLTIDTIQLTPAESTALLAAAPLVGETILTALSRVTIALIKSHYGIPA